MKNTQTHQLVFFILIASLSIITVGGSGGSDTLTSSTILRDGDELVSALGIFALGFFSPANSSNKRYVAIWYNKIITHDIVWVANRNSPISEPGVGLTLSSNGKLLLIGANSSVVYWSSSTSSIVDANTTSPIAQLLDTGNLVVRGADNGYIWQSFDYPTDTFLAGMKLGHDLRSGLNRNLSSWASPSDPSPGLYTAGIALGGVPQLVTTFGPSSFWRGGPWIGKGFSGSPESRSSHFFIVTFVSNSDEIDYFYQSDKITRLILNPNGFGQRLVWLDPPGQWSVFWQAPDDRCDHYAFCGVFGICNSINIPMCVCLNGFQPRDPANWAMMDWSGGCVRKTKLDCGRNGKGIVTDGFVPVSAVKLPDASVAVEDEGLGLDECGARCLMNCSCTGYSLANFTGAGSGCIMWMGRLYDLRVYANNSQVFYLRLAAADLGAVSNQSHNIKLTAIVASIVVSFSVGTLLIGCLLFRYWRKRRSLHSSEEENEESTTTNTGVELPLFDFGTISEATNNFSKDNELGEGGFGRVYMGKTDDGQEIAVKRLSKSSTQGLDEFKNEVMLIAKLQHRNLVRLLGCCVQKQEKMLIYEYMPNKSLDTILFDQKKNVLLNWQMRYDIIVGIARGLLYLHQDSAVRVIHRDLKASNILLDLEMVPKISDFGLARIFAGNEAKSQTKRVVGTYGYMSPEYAIDGIFSVKTDVFSFGVLTLEIISGQKNKGYYVSQAYYHLLRQAWRLWKEGNAMQLVDETIENSCSVAEVLKCIKIGLLCVQERPEERPLMSDIILMLASTNELLPEPKCPGFAAEADSSSSKREPPSVNNVTLTITLGR